MSSFYFKATVANADHQRVSISASGRNRAWAMAQALEILTADLKFDVTGIENMTCAAFTESKMKSAWSAQVTAPIVTENPL